MFDTLWMILTPLEMLFVNLFVIDRCSQRKYGRTVTCLGMGLFMCLLLYVSYLIASMAPGFGSGNGLFVFCGFLFIVPVKLLYKVPGVKIISIACTSWVYTFLLFGLSVRLGYMVTVPSLSLSASVLLYQTLFYVVTFSWFYRMLQEKFIYVLEHVGKKEGYALMWMSMVWFWTVFIFNLSFSYPDLRIFQILSLITLCACILSSYWYIYLQTHSGQTIQSLERIAYQDELTELRSRVVLHSDMEDLIKRRIPFHLIFMDLNNFKSINDRYGHSVGDQYLAFFAREIKVRVGERGGFYRIAGDEFVCIHFDKDLTAFTGDITALPAIMPNSKVPFLGFSYGIASFPADGASGEDLLKYADMRMYDMKRALKRTTQTQSVG